MKTDRIEVPLRLRRARKADQDEIIRVSMSAFRGPATTRERWLRYFTDNPHLSWDRILLVERGQDIVGSAALLDFHVRIGGRAVPADGIAAVAVDPTARRLGVADVMLREAVSDARRRRVPLSLLYAFRPSFYRRFGYAPVEMGHVLHARPRDLPDSVERRHVRSYRPEDLPAVQRCYRAATAEATGPLERSTKWWEWRVLRDDQDRVVYAPGPSGKIEGYILGVLAEPAPLGRRVFRVQEFVATTARARRGLVGWLSSLADEFASLEASLPEDGSWLPFLRDPHLPGIRSHFQQEAAGIVGWGCMARITDLERALALRGGRGQKGSITFELRDPVLAENQAPVTVRFESGRARVRAGAHAKRRVRAGIDVFTQVWMGAVSASHARRYGFLEGDAETAALLDAAWLGPAPFWGTLNEF